MQERLNKKTKNNFERDDSSMLEIVLKINSFRKELGSILLKFISSFYQ